jgi:hypothetical protein|tara:strand:- start:902 stop:1096 length:195 start_codon:yes stop_codon:yes gene_type:complete
MSEHGRFLAERARAELRFIIDGTEDVDGWVTIPGNACRPVAPKKALPELTDEQRARIAERRRNR